MNSVLQTSVDTEKLTQFLSSCEQTFEKSELYSSSSDTKFIDEEVRLSQFRNLNDPLLFSICEDFVAQLNNEDSPSTFTLKRNDVTHIKYEKGGFFSRHQDYLSTSSNLVEEWTMVICVTPPHLALKCKGGETILHHADGSTAYAASTIPGQVLVFRKDIEHEGALLQEGEKHVITLNLWATKKQSSKQVMLVTFAKTAADVSHAADVGEEPPSKRSKSSSNSEKMRKLDAAVNSLTSYALSADQLSGPLLAKLRWANQTAETNDLPAPAVVTFHVQDFSYEEFGTVARVLQGAYITTRELVEHKEALNFFGPFELKDLFVALSTADPATAATDVDNAITTVASSSISYGVNANKFTIPNLILCENESRTKVVAELARELSLPLVPFCMLLVEGTTMFVGGDNSVGATPTPIPMMPAFIGVGDYNNIFLINSMNGRDEVDASGSLAALVDQHSCWKWLKEEEENKLASNGECGGNTLKGENKQGGLGLIDGIDEIPYGSQSVFFPELLVALNCPGEGHQLSPSTFTSAAQSEELKTAALAEAAEAAYAAANPDAAGPDPDAKMRGDPRLLMLYKGEAVKREMKSDEDWQAKSTKQKVLKLVIAEDTYGDPLPRFAYWLPAARTSVESSDTAADTLSAPQGEASFFHRDHSGKTCFTRAQAAATSKRLAEMQLNNMVKKELQARRFVLPQESTTVNSTFCNETVYGRLNLLWVTGVLCLDNVY